MFIKLVDMSGGVDAAVEMQRNVRNNSRDMQESIKELFSWEKEMNAKETAMLKSKVGTTSSIRAASRQAPPAQRQAGGATNSAAAKHKGASS